MVSGQLTARLLGEGQFFLGNTVTGNTVNTVVDTVPLHLPTRKALALLAYLSLEGQTPRAHLAGLLWSGFYDDLARKNLRQELHRLSRTPLGAHLDLSPEHVSLRGDTATDVARFRALAAQGLFGEALGVYSGPLLSGLELRGAGSFDDWLSGWREMLAAERLKVLGKVLEAQQAAGDQRAALATAGLLIAEDEFQERHYRTAMRLHLLLGEREAALQVFGRCRAMLDREFALEPLPETQVLAEQARTLPSLAAPRDVPILEPPLVGRIEVWAQLERAWTAGRDLLLAGEAGVGKSRLLRDFAATKGRVLLLRGQPLDAGVPFATLARMVREVLAQHPDLALPERVRLELARLVPELGERPDTPLRSEEDRLRLFDSYVEYLEAVYTRFDVLLVDDLQYFDASSSELSQYAAARLRERGLRRPSLASLRRDELRPESAAQIEALLRGQDTELIELGALSEAALAELVERLSGRRAVLFPRRLHAATGGNAFFVLETLRGLFEAGELHSEDAGGWASRYDDVTENYLELPLPPSVRQAVLARASRLGAAVRRLLEVGSLAGEPFALETVTQASALSEWEALEGLEAATSAQLLRSEGAAGGGYRFAHELARRALAQAQSPERRRLIHRRLAAQLELSGGPSAVIAGHLEQAALPAEAAAAWLRAAQDAQAVYANAQALSHLGQALSALPESAPERFEVQARRELLARELGERGVQEQALSAMEELAAGTAQQLSALLRRSNFLSIMGRPHDALVAAERAQALAEAQGGPAEQAEAHIRLASALYYAEDFARALTQASAATALPDLTPAQQVQALNLSGIIHAVLRDPEAALADYAAGLLVLGAAPDALLSARIHNNRATTLCLYGAYDAALEDTSASLALIARHGFRQLEGFVLDTRARALRGLGRFPEAQQALDAATSLARETGNQRLVSHCLHHRIQLLNDQGLFAAALNASDEALALASATASVSNRILTLAARAWARLALGHPHDALIEARQAALPGVEALREALPEGVQLILARALEACAQANEAQATLVTARASMQDRLSRLHQPALRQAFTALPLWRTLSGLDQI